MLFGNSKIVGLFSLDILALKLMGVIKKKRRESLYSLSLEKRHLLLSGAYYGT